MSAGVVTASDGGATAPSLRPVTPVGLLAHRLERLTAQAEALSTSLAGSADPAVVEAREGLDELLEALAGAAELAGGLDPYLARHTSPESPDLARLAAATTGHDWSGTQGGELVAVEAEMLSGHVEGELLATLVAATGARRVLEIGMFTGYAALAMAQALPADGVVVACEIDPAVARFAARALEQAGAGDRVEVRVGPAEETLADVTADDAFDLVFLDADKPGYRHYVETLLDRGLLAPTGLLVVDNTLMQGQPWTGAEAGSNGRAIEDFNEWLGAETRVRQVLVPLRDGVTLVRWDR